MVSKLIYRKSDVWTNISISLLSLLIYNPFCIGNISLILSYVGTIGILTYSINFKQTNKIKRLVKELYPRRWRLNCQDQYQMKIKIIGSLNL